MFRPAAVRLALALTLAACACSRPAAVAPTLDPIADAYVQLVLAVGRHDPNFVDAYYGPPEWKAAAEQGEPRTVAQLLDETRALLIRVHAAPGDDRRGFLEKQLVAVQAFLERQAGTRRSLAEEARLLFDVEPPACPDAALEAARARLEALLPGEGTLAERVQALRARVEVPPERLPAVIDAALAEVRRRTAALVALPDGESFRVAYVTGKPWGAYNWYKGGLASLIEVNTDLPMTLDAALSTMAHEGYPGHHAYNALLEDRLVRAKGWREYTVYPLYSPQSLIAEGTANAGLDVVMSPEEQRTFLRDALAPLAGVDGAALELWRQVQEANAALDCIDGEAARQLLDEGLPEEEVAALLERYGRPPKRARQNVAFYQAYRAYIFTYSVGEELIEAWLATTSDPVAAFFDLLQRPATPGGLS